MKIQKAVTPHQVIYNELLNNKHDFINAVEAINKELLKGKTCAIPIQIAYSNGTGKVYTLLKRYYKRAGWGDLVIYLPANSSSSNGQRNVKILFNEKIFEMG